MHQLRPAVEQIRELESNAFRWSIFFQIQGDESLLERGYSNVVFQFVIDDNGAEVEEVGSRPRGIEGTRRNGMESRRVNRVLKPIQPLFVRTYKQH